MKEFGLSTEFFLTQILHRSVLDRNGEEVGTVSDLLIGTQGETFPKIIGLEVEARGAKRIVSKEEIDLLSRRIVTLHNSNNRIPWRQAAPEDLFLNRDFLDKQILDIHGAKVVRVNDLKIAYLNREFHLIAAEVGFQGLLRRINLEKFCDSLLHWFGKSLRENLIPWNFVEPISSQNMRMKLTVPQSKVAMLHPADIADILKELAPPERAAMIDSLHEEVAADALHDVEPELSLEILDDLTPEKAATILYKMNFDDVADILTKLPEDHRQEILSRMPTEAAADLNVLLSHHNEATAGGMMTSEYVSFPEDLTVEQVINQLRKLEPDAEVIYYLYVVDQQEHLQGVVSLRDLIISKPEARLKDIMMRKVVTIPVSAKKEEAADLIAKYDLLALPVVDGTDKMVGIVTVDDVMDLLVSQGGRRKGFMNK